MNYEIIPPIPPQIVSHTMRRSKRKCVATAETINEQLQNNTPLQNLANLCGIFDSFIRNLVQNGTLIFHTHTNEKICVIMNDYNSENGKFCDYEYIYTCREITEEGFLFRCSCRIYKTLLECAGSEDVSYDSLDISTGIKCMHCRFLKDYIIPVLDNHSDNETQLSTKVMEGLGFCGKPFVKLTGKNGTKKFSIFDSLEDDPSFVHITFNAGIDRYVISCMNGYCKSVRGSKRNIDNFSNSKTLCKHLKVIYESQEWTEFKTENGEDIELDQTNLENNSAIPEIELDIESELLSDPTDHDVFDQASGLWKFPCKSTHTAQMEYSEELSYAVQARDMLNDKNSDCVPRIDGCLKGPILVHKSPTTTCPCGVGWTNNNNPQGVTTFSRKLIIYTEIAPVACHIHTRVCLASLCKLEWDEGKELCLHVYSSETAAGDEIGWMFVNQVVSSKITFSGFCKNMSSTYKRRCVYSRGFMDPGVFLKWWFSWASNMKIDFRRPCSICKFKPKQLACDGTKIGIGFRNAKFEPIEKSRDNVLHETLHRRLDRCFLTQSVDISANVLMICREHMFHLGSVVSDDKYVKDDKLTEEVIKARTDTLLQIFPEEALPSLRRFLDEMPDLEKDAYGKLLVMLSSTAPLSTVIPDIVVADLRQLLVHINGDDPHPGEDRLFNSIMHKLRFFCPEIRTLIANSMYCNFDRQGENVLPDDILSFVRYILNRVSTIEMYPSEQASEQLGTYNPPKYGRAYYFSPSGCSVRSIRNFTIDQGKTCRNTVADDNPMPFETCNKLFSKVQVSARGSTSLFLWFCPSHGHCYGFHMAYAEGRKDPYASLYSYLEIPPDEIFYDFGCNLQEYCLNRESEYFRSVRFFHDIFHGYSHKCSRGYRSSRLLGFDAINSEICEQFNSFIQCIKSAARQMNQTHFCFYLQFFLHMWNTQKQERYKKKLMVALAGSD
ncbi:uncharacterized protein [Argopecten irradians]|uniref:uncharacterized protein n=1 Tax=Argopecten irradians TaxID=31199 RepID=UPI003724BE4E